MKNCYNGCYLELDNLCLSLKDPVQGRLDPISFVTSHVILSMTKDGLARFVPFRPAAFLCSVHSLSKQPRLSNNNYIQFSIFGTLPHLLSYFRITYPRVSSNFDRRLFIAASSSCASRPQPHLTRPQESGSESASHPLHRCSNTDRPAIDLILP